jgi:hypothetical protein
MTTTPLPLLPSALLFPDNSDEVPTISQQMLPAQRALGLDTLALYFDLVLFSTL